MGISGKTVVVTGGAAGIGKAVAEKFAIEGALVVIADIDAEKGAAAAGEINSFIRNTAEEKGEKGKTDNGKGVSAEEKDHPASFIKTDVSLPVECANLMEKVYQLHGRIDILINNAGISMKVPLEKLTEENWHRIIDTNLGGVMFCSRAASQYMKENNSGVIINIASTRAFMSEADSEAYAASKGGVVSLTHALSASLSRYRIRVNSISPGWIETGDYSLISEEDHNQHFSRRVGKPDDIARACLFLADPENDFINSENLAIDGGMTRKMIYL